MLVMTHLFTPADGSPPREIKATIETQEDAKHPFLVTIDFGDGHKDRVPWLEPSFFGLELAARFFAQRVLDHIELEGGGTLDPDVGRPLDYASSLDRSDVAPPG